jgi:hypothetical protein
LPHNGIHDDIFHHRFQTFTKQIFLFAHFLLYIYILSITWLSFLSRNKNNTLLLSLWLQIIYTFTKHKQILRLNIWLNKTLNYVCNITTLMAHNGCLMMLQLILIAFIIKLVLNICYKIISTYLSFTGCTSDARVFVCSSITIRCLLMTQHDHKATVHYPLL